MALSKDEKAILEAVSSMLQQDARLGLPINGEKLESSHDSQFRWEGIDDAFGLKIAESAFADAISSAFFAVHSHKYIDSPTFKLSFEKEMTARAIPTEERDQALKYFDTLVEELSAKTPSERDAGWNDQLAEIADMTRNADTRGPKPSKPFTGGGPAPEGDRDTGKSITEDMKAYPMGAKPRALMGPEDADIGDFSTAAEFKRDIAPDDVRYCLYCDSEQPFDENGCITCGGA